MKTGLVYIPRRSQTVPPSSVKTIGFGGRRLWPKLFYAYLLNIEESDLKKRPSIMNATKNRSKLVLTVEYS